MASVSFLPRLLAYSGAPEHPSSLFNSYISGVGPEFIGAQTYQAAPRFFAVEWLPDKTLLLNKVNQ